MLLSHRIGLWDVIGRCKRLGSSDSNIRNAQQNRFKRITGIARHLRRVCFNGKTAGKLEPWFAEQGYETIVLPSSSPANTIELAVKLEAWRGALCRSGRAGAQGKCSIRRDFPW